MIKRVRSQPRRLVDAPTANAIVRSPDSHSIEKAWRTHCVGGAIPLRGMLSPNAIGARLLANVGICSIRIEERKLEASYRLAGSRFRHLTGIELTGVSYETLLGSSAVEERVSLLRKVIERPVGIWWVSEVTFGDSYILPYQSTIFPLASQAGGVPDHVLDFVECAIPIAASGMTGTLSRNISRYAWIDIGAGTPAS